VAPGKGRFRSFLLACLCHHLADQKDQANAQKRGGGQRVFSLERLPAEERYLREEPSRDNPEHFYERQWALSVIEATLDRLGAEAAGSGKGELFAALRGALIGEKGVPSCAEVARRLGLNEATVRSAVHRLRERYRELFREEIAQTVNEPDEVDDEIRHLLSVPGE
jgi:DNA-directed RNA polymerase specialized sigma24 family protein